MRVTGASGLLRRGYQTAATLGAWALTRDGDTVTVLASVASFDAYWLSERPLELRLHMQQRVWAWPDVQVTIQDGGSSLTIVTHGSPLVL